MKQGKLKASPPVSIAPCTSVLFSLVLGLCVHLQNWACSLCAIQTVCYEQMFTEGQLRPGFGGLDMGVLVLVLMEFGSVGGHGQVGGARERCVVGGGKRGGFMA